jgi:branched-chain amino acid aminotransferase
METENKTEPERGFPPGIAFIDGGFCDISEARISILDFGFLHSDATYDVVHVWRRRFFRLDRHLDRFLDNVAKLRLALPFDRATLIDTLKECVRRSGHDDAYVEMICTRGTAPGYSRDPRRAINRFIAFAIPFSWVANEEQRRRGLNLFISTVSRIPSRSVDPTIKNYHWLDFIKGTFEAYDHGAETVVLVDGDGNITEGPGFNLFAVAGGRVTTPRQGTLNGITRATTLELCAELGIEADEGVVTAGRLGAADEAFITSTAGGIMAVTRIDGAPLGDDRPGPLTARLTDLYWRKHDDPGWTTPVD